MRYVSIIMVSLLAIGKVAHSQGIHAVEALSGYVCMELALAPGQYTDPKIGVPIRETPSRSASVASYAGTIVIVRASQQPTTGFLQVLRPNGLPGWIEATYLRPWHNPYDPNAQCMPSMMSNGKPGFDVKH
jgi:hypothetical protein